MKKEITIDGAVYILKETTKSKESKAYIPVINEKYQCIDSLGLIHSIKNENDYMDKQYAILGNYAKTEQDLEGYDKYIEYLYEVKKYILENHLFIPDWNNVDQKKYYLYKTCLKTCLNNKMTQDYCYNYNRLNILPYLSSAESCQDVIKKFEEELHYIFDYNNIRLN